MSRPIVVTVGLGKRYGKPPGHRALSDLDLSIERGEIFGFLGPNGAGKSTAIRILLGLLKPSEGTASVFGRDAWTESPSIRQGVGYLPGEVRFRERQTGRQIVSLFEQLRGRSCQYDQLAERLELDLDRSVRAYSKGMKQKLGLIQALMHEPELIILDEPTSGLDPFTQRTVNELLRERREGGATVFFSSHVLPEVEGLCDRIALLRRGRLLRCSALADFDELRVRRFEVQFRNAEDAERAIVRLEAVAASVEAVGGMAVGQTLRVSSLLELVTGHDGSGGLAGIELDSLKVEGLRLEDLFYRLYGEDESSERSAR